MQSRTLLLEIRKCCVMSSRLNHAAKSKKPARRYGPVLGGQIGYNHTKFRISRGPREDGPTSAAAGNLCPHAGRPARARTHAHGYACVRRTRTCVHRQKVTLVHGGTSCKFIRNTWQGSARRFSCAQRVSEEKSLKRARVREGARKNKR